MCFAQGAHLGAWVDSQTRPTLTNCVFAGNGSYALEAPVDDLGLITGTAFGPNQLGLHLDGGPITHSAAWQKSDVPPVLSGGITISAGETVSIEPGAVLLMDRNAYLQVEGTLKAQGTDTAPIAFTSAPQISGSSPVPGWQPKPGDWQYIRLDGSGASASVLDHVQLFYGSANGGAFGMLSLTQGANITLSNSVLAQGAHLGAWVDSQTRPTVTNCVFAGNGNYALEAPVDDLGLITGTAFGPNQLGLHLIGGPITHSATWFPTDVPVVLSQGSTLAAGAGLALAPGVVIQMDKDAYLQINGTLKAQGTAAAPIVITSAAAQPKPGDWQYIRIDGSGASASVLDHVQIYYGSANGGAEGVVSVTDGASPAITHSILAQSAHDGVWVQTGHPTIAFCEFRGNGGPAISVPALDPQHIHDNTFAPGQPGLEVRCKSDSSVSPEPSIERTCRRCSAISQVSGRVGALLEFANWPR